jgi:hypothetical protein
MGSLRLSPEFPISSKGALFSFIAGPDDHLAEPRPQLRAYRTRIGVISMSNQLWYVRDRNSVTGPFSLEQLTSLRRRGQLARFHQVSEDRQTWVAASTLTDLFANPPTSDSFELASTPGPSSPPARACWYYHDGQTAVGPISEHELLGLVKSGKLQSDTMVWKEGMTSWALCGSALPTAKPVSTVSFYCAHCGSPLAMDKAYSGQEALCGACHAKTIVPDWADSIPPAPSAAYRPTPTYAPGPSDDRKGIVIPVLISAIGNIVIGVFWVSTICGIVLAVPMFVLSIFEFLFYSDSDRLPRNTLTSRAETLAIFEIICGFANLVSLICGILVLINAGRYKRRSQA